MIGYFIKSGDAKVDAMFAPYIWGPSGLGTMLKAIRHRDYGKALTLLLIQYYVEGQFPVLGPESLKVRNYSAKNKDIAVAIPVRRSDFHDVTDAQRKQFIFNSTLAAVDGVRARLGPRQLGLDFDSLRNDVTQIGDKYLRSEDLSKDALDSG